MCPKLGCSGIHHGDVDGMISTRRRRSDMEPPQPSTPQPRWPAWYIWLYFAYLGQNVTRRQRHRINPTRRSVGHIFVRFNVPRPPLNIVEELPAKSSMAFNRSVAQPHGPQLGHKVAETNHDLRAERPGPVSNESFGDGRRRRVALIPMALTKKGS